MTIQPSEDEVVSYFDKLSNWGRWGPDDRLGTLNLITDETRRRIERDLDLEEASLANREFRDDQP